MIIQGSPTRRQYWTCGTSWIFSREDSSYNSANKAESGEVGNLRTQSGAHQAKLST